MAGSDERCEGDVKKLTLFFETLAAGASSPDTRKSSKIINRKGCGGSAGSGTHNTGYIPIFFRSDASADGGKLVPCDVCSQLHPPYPDCPYRPIKPCSICDKPHNPVYCPYLDRLPRGATYGPGYDVVCRCGNFFNEDKWGCTSRSCGGNRPRLKPKYCSICNSHTQHSAYECPKDKVLAAKYKLVREKRLSRAPSRKPSSGIPYVPTKRSGSVYGDMEGRKDPVFIPKSYF